MRDIRILEIYPLCNIRKPQIYTLCNIRKPKIYPLCNIRTPKIYTLCNIKPPKACTMCSIRTLEIHIYIHCETSTSEHQISTHRATSKAKRTPEIYTLQIRTPKIYTLFNIGTSEICAQYSIWTLVIYRMCNIRTQISTCCARSGNQSSTQYQSIYLYCHVSHKIYMHME